MSKMGKKLAAVGLCACLAATALTGCGSKENKEVIKVDDTVADYGLVNFALRYSQAQLQATYEPIFGENMWATYGDTTKESVISTLQTMMVMEDHMDEYGISVTEEDKTAIAETAKTFLESNDEEALEAMNATTENVERLLTLYTIQARMYDEIVKDATVDVPEEELTQKTIQYAIFSAAGKTDEEGKQVDPTAEEKAELREQAVAVLEGVKGGKTLEEALKEVDEKKTVITSSYGVNNGDVLSDIKMVADGLKDGQVAPEVFETNSSYYVIQMVSTNDEEATASYKAGLLEEAKDETFTGVVQGWIQNADITLNSGLITGMTFVDKFTNATEAAETESETAAE